jgi:chemotaxis protein MotA
MFVIIGWAVALVGVFGGFAMAGGHLAALFQPLELVMIGGGAFGALSPPTTPMA